MQSLKWSNSVNVDDAYLRKPSLERDLRSMPESVVCGTAAQPAFAALLSACVFSAFSGL